MRRAALERGTPRRLSKPSGMAGGMGCTAMAQTSGLKNGSLSKRVGIKPRWSLRRMSSSMSMVDEQCTILPGANRPCCSSHFTKMLPMLPGQMLSAHLALLSSLQLWACCKGWPTRPLTEDSIWHSGSKMISCGSSAGLPSASAKSILPSIKSGTMREKALR